MHRDRGILWLVDGVTAPVLCFEPRSLVVIGGPSGAGKTTLAERVAAGAPVFDPDAVRAALAAEREVPLDEVPWPEALARTRARYAERLAAGEGVVVITTAVRRGHRIGLARDAALSAATCHLVMLDASADECRAGRAAQAEQRIPGGLFEHLLREWAAFRRALADPLDPEGVVELFGSVTVLDRRAAAALTRIDLTIPSAAAHH